MSLCFGSMFVLAKVCKQVKCFQKKLRVEILEEIKIWILDKNVTNCNVIYRSSE